MKKSKYQSTIVLHSGQEFNTTGAIVSPVWQSVNYQSKDLNEMAEISVQDRPVNFYSRYSSPSLNQAGRILADLEKTEDAVILTSGMAAISSAILAAVKCGDHIVAQSNLYATTLKFLRDVLPVYGVTTTFVDQTDNNAFEKAIKENTALIYVETPSNPLMKITDLDFIGKLSSKNNIISVIDNTFASPVNLNPVDFGIDVICHSCTKYLGGHSDVLAGAVCGSHEIVHKTWDLAHLLGHTLAPTDTFLLLRGLKTLTLRVQRQNENSLILAEHLLKNKKVKAVHHPGLASHQQHELAAKQMRGFGGTFSFELNTDYEKAKKFAESLNICKIAVSLGGVESTITLPAAQWKPFYTDEQLKEAGIPESLIRISTGIEDISDIIDDIEQGLTNV
ncbi:methionine gamma-lyase [soil metagenome]